MTGEFNKKLIRKKMVFPDYGFAIINRNAPVKSG
jgi:hypothetical protein